VTIGIVIIGKNEGQRLVRCLSSAISKERAVIYVDSGSMDGSAEKAVAMGAQLVSLDLSKPFTAARARNAGFAELKGRDDLDFVQFVDGDCELVEGWLEKAQLFLAENEEYAAVCGRRRERRPGVNIFHRQADDEWNTPIGDADSCGGDVMLRANALAEIGAYDPTLIAGEEPEMCVRLREKGWKIRRLDADMTMHDIDITRFSQWWSRAVRAGHAFAEVSAKHRASHKRIWVTEARRAVLWSSLAPISSVLGFILHPVLWALLTLYPLQIVRLILRGESPAIATLLVIGKFAEGWGALKYWRGRLTGGKSDLIEYKAS